MRGRNLVVGKVTVLLGHFREGYMKSKGLDANFHHTGLDVPLFNFHAGGVYKVEESNLDDILSRLKKLPEIERGYYVFVSDSSEVMCSMSKDNEYLCFDTFQTVDVEKNSSDEVLEYGFEIGKSIENLVLYLTSNE